MQRELADAVHVSLDVPHRLPGERAAGAFSERDVKELVIALEGDMIGALRDLCLQIEQIVDPLPRSRIERFAGAPHDRRLDRLADEARLHHLRHGDFDDDGAALRHHFDQARLRQRDQRLAHRLARHAVARGDVLLRQPHAGRKLHRHDRAAKLRLDPPRRRYRAAAAPKVSICGDPPLSRHECSYYHTGTTAQ